jgi:hypothetical protein
MRRAGGRDSSMSDVIASVWNRTAPSPASSPALGEIRASHRIPRDGHAAIRVGGQDWQRLSAAVI